MSVRATNVLLRNCSSLEELVSLNEENLYSFPNSGRKTVCEILGFLDSVRSERGVEPSPTVQEQLPLPPDESSVFLLPLFSTRKIEDLCVDVSHPNFHAFTKLSDLDLSVRTVNVLNVMGMETVGEVMLTPGSVFLEQQNFGKKSLNELKDIVFVLCLTNGDMSVSSNDKTESDKIAIDETESDKITIDYKSYENMVSNFIEQFEKKKRNQDLFKRRLCFEDGKVPTLEELGRTFGITRERVRQILKKMGRKLEKKANIEKLSHFWERLDCCVAQGGGVISLRALPSLLQSEFKWSTAPYSLALGQLLSCWQQEGTLRDDRDLLFVESECLSCNLPLQQLQALNFDENQSFHVQVIVAKLSRHCQSNCPWKQPVTTFHRAFIERLVGQSQGCLILHGDVVLSHDKWLGKYCDNLEDVVCYILGKNGKPMHFREIAGGVRRENENFMDMSDHNVHAAIMRYNKIEIVDRGTYALKSWGLGGYRSVTTAIEDFIEKKGLPQKRKDIIQHLKGEFTEGNITTSLTKETRFTNIGDGLFYDLPSNWQHRTCQELIRLLAEPVVEFARYLVGRNNTSYKLVMAFIFIRSMDENGTIPLYKLKEMFYRFYLSRFKKGLPVEVDTAVVNRIGDLSVGEVKSKACKEPLKSFSSSGFFMQFALDGGKLCLTHGLVVELCKSLVRDVVLIIILKAIDDYFQKITPAFNAYVQVAEKRHDFSNSPFSVGEGSGESCVESGDVAPSISIKKKGRGKIRL